MPTFDRADVVLSYSESGMIDEKGSVLAENYIEYVSDIDAVRWTADYQRSGQEEIGQALAIKNTIPNVSAVVFRRMRSQKCYTIISRSWSIPGTATSPIGSAIFVYLSSPVAWLPSRQAL